MPISRISRRTRCRPATTPLAAQMPRHLPPAVERMLQVQPVHPAHQRQVLRALPKRFVVLRRPAHADQLADLKRRFINLEQAMVAKERKWKKSDLVAWTQERLTIEADELPVKRVLDVITT